MRAPHARPAAAGRRAASSDAERAARADRPPAPRPVRAPGTRSPRDDANTARRAHKRSAASGCPATHQRAGRSSRRALMNRRARKSSLVAPILVLVFTLGATTAWAIGFDRRSSGASGIELSVSEVYAKSAGGVVLVEVTRKAGVGPYSAGPGRALLEPSGSGFVLDRDGRIVTNAHVVADAAAIGIRLADGTQLPAKLLASDPGSDVAVLDVNVPARALTPLPLAESSRVEIGQSVVAIGSPFGLQGSVTAGIVSAVGRTFNAPDSSPITGAIQTDAAINHGNSGGPLLDLGGNVIGLVAQFQSASGGSNGVAMAVPANTVAAVVTRLAAGRPRTPHG